MSSTEPHIPEWLANASFEKLFFSEEPLKALNQPDEEAAVAAVAASPAVSPKLRVLAHELLIDAGHAADPSLAEIYCRTLPDTFSHNAWGMPGHYTERLGKMVVTFGKAALPCLITLFGDQRPLGYFGSEEPTLSEQMQYRVGDLAAYLASLIAGVPYLDAPDASTRDAFIEQLKTDLIR
jgi:hypothetical protein